MGIGPSMADSCGARSAGQRSETSHHNVSLKSCSGESTSRRCDLWDSHSNHSPNHSPNHLANGQLSLVGRRKRPGTPFREPFSPSTARRTTRTVPLPEHREVYKWLFRVSVCATMRLDLRFGIESSIALAGHSMTIRTHPCDKDADSSIYESIPSICAHSKQSRAM